MIQPSKEVLMAISQLDGMPAWAIFQKWIRASLPQALEATDSGVAKGAGLQLVYLLETIENHKEQLKAMEKKS